MYAHPPAHSHNWVFILSLPFLHFMFGHSSSFIKTSRTKTVRLHVPFHIWSVSSSSQWSSYVLVKWDEVDEPLTGTRCFSLYQCCPIEEINCHPLTAAWPLPLCPLSQLQQQLESLCSTSFMQLPLPASAIVGRAVWYGELGVSKILYMEWTGPQSHLPGAILWRHPMQQGGWGMACRHSTRVGENTFVWFHGAAMQVPV